MTNFTIDSKQLRNTLETFGAKFNNNVLSNVEQLNAGAESSLFSINNTNNVLKIGHNFEEYNGMDFLDVEQHFNPLIKRFFLLPEFYKNDDVRYIYVFKKLHKLDTEYSKVLRSIEFMIDEVNVENMFSLEKDKTEVLEYLKEKGYVVNYTKFVNFLIQVHKLLDKYNLRDIHIDNIMMDDKVNFKIIDVQRF